MNASHTSKTNDALEKTDQQDCSSREEGLPLNSTISSHPRASARQTSAARSTVRIIPDGLSLPKRLMALGLPAFTAALGLYAQTPSELGRQQSDNQAKPAATTGGGRSSSSIQPSAKDSRSESVTAEIEATRKAIQQEKAAIAQLLEQMAAIKAESARVKSQADKLEAEALAQQKAQATPPTASTPQSVAPPTGPADQAPTPQTTQTPQTPSPLVGNAQFSAGTPVPHNNIMPMQPPTHQATRPSPTGQNFQAPNISPPVAPAPPNSYYNTKPMVLDDATIRKHLASGYQMPEGGQNSPSPTPPPPPAPATTLKPVLVSITYLSAPRGRLQPVVIISDLPPTLTGQMIINRVQDRCKDGTLRGIAYLYDVNQIPKPQVQIHLNYNVAPEPVRDAIIKHVLTQPFYPGGR